MVELWFAKVRLIYKNMRILFFVLVCMSIVTAIMAQITPQPSETEKFSNEPPLELVNTESLNKYLEQKKWDKYFKMATRIMFSNKICKTGEREYVDAKIFILKEFSRLPEEAIKWFRNEYDSIAKEEFRYAKENKDINKIVDLISKYFLSSFTDDVAYYVGNYYFTRGNLFEAMYFWKLILDIYPDADIPRQLLAAKIALVYKQIGLQNAIDALKETAQKSGYLANSIIVDNKPTTLGQFLDSLKVEDVFVSAVSAGSEEEVLLYPEYLSGAVALGPKSWEHGCEHELMGFTVPPFSSVTGRSRRYEASPPMIETLMLPLRINYKGQDILIVNTGMYILAYNLERQEIMWRFQIPQESKNLTTLEGVQISIITNCAYEGEDVYPILYNPFSGTFEIQRLTISSWKRKYLAGNKAKICSLDFKDIVGKPFLTITSAPVISGDRIFLGLKAWEKASPFPGSGYLSISSVESWVICLNKYTGDILWSKKVCEKGTSSTDQWWRGYFDNRVAATIITLNNLLYVQTGTGVIAALNPVNGDIMWLREYPRVEQQIGYYEPYKIPFIRPPTLPVFYKDLAIFFPQDSYRPVVCDVNSGTLPQKLPEGLSSIKKCGQLIGTMKNKLILSKVISQEQIPAYIVNLDNSEGIRILDHSGILWWVDEDSLYYIHMYPDKKYTIVRVASPDFSLKNTKQSLLLESTDYQVYCLDDYLLFINPSKLKIFLDDRKSRYMRQRLLVQEPIDPELLYVTSKRAFEVQNYDTALEWGKKFLESVGEDISFKNMGTEVRDMIFQVLIKQAGELYSKRKYPEALERYREAEKFGTSPVPVKIKIAELLEILSRYSEAVEEYQFLLIQAPHVVYIPENKPNTVYNAGHFCRENIKRLIKQHGRQIYQQVEQRAEQEFSKINPDNTDALKDFINKFPNSVCARKAILRVTEGLVKKGAYGQAVTFVYEYIGFYKDEIGEEVYQNLIEALKNLGNFNQIENILPHVPDKLKEIINKLLEEIKQKFQTRENNSSQPSIIATLPGKRVLVPHMPLPNWFAQNYLLTISADNVVTFYDIRTKERVWNLSYFKEETVKGAFFTPGGNLIILYPKAFCMINPISGKLIYMVKADKLPGATSTTEFSAIFSSMGRIIICESSPPVVTPYIDSAFTAANVSKIWCLEEATGRFLWSRELPEPSYLTVSARDGSIKMVARRIMPTVQAGVAELRLTRLDINGVDEEQLEQKIIQMTQVGCIFDPATELAFVFTPSQKLLCYDFEQKIRFIKDISLNGWREVIIGQKYVFLFFPEPIAKLIIIDKQTFKTLCKMEFQDNMVYVDGNAVADIENNRFGSPSFSSIIIDKQKLAITGLDHSGYYKLTIYELFEKIQIGSQTLLGKGSLAGRKVKIESLPGYFCVMVSDRYTETENRVYFVDKLTGKLNKEEKAIAEIARINNRLILARGNEIMIYDFGGR